MTKEIFINTITGGLLTIREDKKVMLINKNEWIKMGKLMGWKLK